MYNAYRRRICPKRILRVVNMRKRISTSIEVDGLKSLDHKIVQSDFFRDRSSYIEFLIRFLPYIPDDTKPDADIEQLIMRICAGLSSPGGDPNAKPGKPVQNEHDSEIIKMVKNFNFAPGRKNE